jgi:hypothetical protein
MKQYTTPEQTAKLIELGFEKPKMAAPALKWVDGEPTFEPQYTIGELIEMLPKSLKNSYNPPLIKECNEKWRVYYGVQEDYSWEWSIWFEVERKELIDVLYDMCVKLKQKGVM